MLPPKLLIGVPADGVGPPEPEEAPKCMGICAEGLRTGLDCMKDIAEMEGMRPGVRAGVCPGVMRPVPKGVWEEPRWRFGIREGNLEDASARVGRKVNLLLLTEI